MIYLQFLLGLIIYSMYAYVSYTPSMKSSSWYFPVGLLMALLANAVWLWIARAEKDPTQILIKGLYWDLVVTAVTIGAPILMFGAALTARQGFGLALLIVGLVLVKL